MKYELNRIEKPALLLDEEKCRANIAFMAGKARRLGLIFRPHFKTHQSRLVGRWFRDEGVDRITVSSLGMARYFAEDGWDDITIAFPFNLRESSGALELGRKIRLNLLFTSACSLEDFASKVKGHPQSTGIFIKIDTGYHRTGLQPGDSREIERMIGICRDNPGLVFKGFLTHTGQTYQARGKAEVESASRLAIRSMELLKREYCCDGSDILLSAGDTPACSLLEDFGGIDEIRPGNFVFYDVMQYNIGSCLPGQIAVCLAAPVVAMDASRLEAVIYGGAIHLSKESVEIGGERVYGLVCRLGPDGWSEPLPGCYVSGLSQEHGILKLSSEVFESFRSGDLAGILPVHSCLAAQCCGTYTLSGGIDEIHM